MMSGLSSCLVNLPIFAADGALSRAVESELFLSLCLVLVPWMLGKLFRSLVQWARSKRDEGIEKALLALEAGVDEAWELFGRAWKKARADGKLSQKEREDLRKCARELALGVGKSRGVDVLKLLGERTLRVFIRRIVEARKSGKL